MHFVQLSSTKFLRTKTTFCLLPPVGGHARDVERYVWQRQQHTSHTYRRPRDGLARMAGRRAAQGRSRRQRGRGGGEGAAAAEGQMHSVPKGRCAKSHPRLHSIRAAEGLLLTKKKHHHYNYRNTRCVTTPVYDKVGYHCKTKNIAIVSNCPDITI